MAIFQALFAALGRQVGRLLNTVFGWATTTLYGKAPQERQTLLSVIALGSVVWIPGLFLLGVNLMTRAGATKSGDRGASTQEPRRLPSVWPDGRRIDISAPRARPVEEVDEASRERLLS